MLISSAASFARRDPQAAACPDGRLTAWGVEGEEEKAVERDRAM